jgi:NAD(P)-dependent dehydrogenase (short-subunit alcohol dehydrogenase family)
MKKQAYGRIINSSSSATLGIGTIAAYSSAKAALLGLTADAAIEGKAHNILVNAMFPAGYSRLVARAQENHRVWMEKYFQPELVARAVAFLVSREMKASGEIYGIGAGRVSRLALFNNDGYFDRELSAESVGEHMDKIRDLAGAEHVASSAAENFRYARWVPWDGGHFGTF